MANDGIGRLSVIGAGAMGSALAAGVISAGIVRPDDVTMADVDSSKLERLSAELGAAVTSDNLKAIQDADVVIIAVKPWFVENVLKEIGQKLNSNQMVISIAAGVKLESIEAHLADSVAVIRSMPNTPCLIGAGAVGFSRGKAATDRHVAIAKDIFDAVGISFEVAEKLLDAVTGLSGSGPAYVYLMIEAMSDAGVRVGLPRDISLKLAAQTVMGSARMVIEAGEHPAKLRDQVTTPGGTTIAGLDALEKAGFRSALMEAVKAATKRSEELG